jgi:hypothetical protein
LIPTAAVVAFIGFCFVYVIFRILLHVAEGVSNLSRRLQSTEARVVAKRAEIGGYPRGRTSTAYFVTFQFDDGSRREFRLSGAQFGLLVEGDAGLLSWQGTAYRGFDRRPVAGKMHLESPADF